MVELHWMVKFIRVANPLGTGGEGMPKQKYSPSTIATVRQLVPIDDVLFQKMSESKKVCQELISTILGKNIKVAGT